MKKSFTSILVIISILIFTGCQRTKPELYSSEEYNFEYPVNYIISTNNDNVLLFNTIMLNKNLLIQHRLYINNRMTYTLNGMLYMAIGHTTIQNTLQMVAVHHVFDHSDKYWM